MANKQSGINEESSLDMQNPLYSENIDGNQTDFTPSTSYVGGGYVGASDNAGDNVGSYVGASYVGADRVVSAGNRKKGNFRKTLLVSIIAIVAVVALVAFVIWPLLIYPNMANDDLYTPELLQVYSGTYKTGSGKTGDAIVTIESCDAQGNITGTFEFILEKKYGKYTITGTITEKKNSGNLKLTILPGQWVIQPENFSMLESMEVEVTDNCQSFACSQYSMNWTVGGNDEYAIKNANDLKKLVNSDATFQLKNDIDMSGIEWTPIEGFTGMLAGNGFTIKNLTINASSSNVGLFSTLKGTVQNLKIENASITVSGRNENVGILCGDLEGTAINISVSGVVDASKCTNVGGVFGIAERSINPDLSLSNLSNAASVSGLTNVGGIAGYVSLAYVDATLDGLTNTGKITAGEDAAGGIIGRLFSDTGLSSWPIVLIVDCENTGDVEGRYYVGGIAGYAKSGDLKESVIENAVCKANIKGEAYVGCIAGNLISIKVNDCENTGSTLTATGTITEKNTRCAYVGGFVGAGGEVANCTNEVEIRYTGGGSYVGGVIGYVNLSINPDVVTFKNVSNNAPVSGASYVGGVAGYIYCEYITLQIESAENTANITGTGDYVGGIVGYGRASDYDGYVYIYDSNNSGNIQGNTYVGGIMGYGRASYNGSMISGCSSTGSVSGKAKTGTYAGELDTIVVQ